MKLKSTLLALACTIGLSAGSAIASEGVSSKTAPTKTVDVGGTPFVYRELGPKNGIPVVFLQHLGGSMDDWDPTVVDGIAKRHHVIVFDNKGVAGSGGATPTSMPEMGKDAVAFIHALGLRQVDLLGFSIGGFVAQSIAQTEPSLVHKLILAGTGPAGYGDQVDADGKSRLGKVLQDAYGKAAAQKKNPRNFLFFTQTDAGQAAAGEYLARLNERQVDRDKPVGQQTLQAQQAAIAAWLKDEASASARITAPTFIVNGDHDAMVATSNSFELLQRIPGATLSIYPDAGHGGIFQHHVLFVEQALKFLD